MDIYSCLKNVVARVGGVEEKKASITYADAKGREVGEDGGDLHHGSGTVYGLSRGGSEDLVIGRLMRWLIGET